MTPVPWPAVNEQTSFMLTFPINMSTDKHWKLFCKSIEQFRGLFDGKNFCLMFNRENYLTWELAPELQTTIFQKSYSVYFD